MASGFTNNTMPNQNFAQGSPKTVWRGHLAIHRPTYVLIHDLSAVQIGDGWPFCTISVGHTDQYPFQQPYQSATQTSNHF